MSFSPLNALDVRPWQPGPSIIQQGPAPGSGTSSGLPASLAPLNFSPPVLPSPPSSTTNVSLLGTLGGIASGFLTGGPAGAVAGGILGAFGGTPKTPIGPAVPSGSPFGIGAGINIGGPTGITLRGGTGGWNQAAPGAVMSGTGAPRGYHLNKHALPASRSHPAVAARTIYVRNRRMNPLNPRALRKALAREKAARHLMGKLHIFKAHRSLAPRRKK